MFSDEPTIAVLENRKERVRTRINDEFLSQCLKIFPNKIMIWVPISWKGTSRLHIIEVLMNSVQCIEVLKRKAITQARDWYPEED